MSVDTKRSPSSTLSAQQRDPHPLARWSVPFLILITLLVLGRVCFAQFTTWDDDFNIVQNPAMLPPTSRSMLHIWTGPQFMQYIPLSFTLWGLISWATQTTDAAGHIVQVAWPFHASNLGIHIIAVVIVYRLLKGLDLAPFACLCGAMLFAMHPVQVEPVAWVSGFRDVLSGALSLAAVQQYLRYARAAEVVNARFHYFWASAAFLAAVLAKNSAMTLPLCVLAVDRLVVGRPWRRALTPAIAWMIIAIPFAILARVLQNTTKTPPIPLWTRPFIAADSLTFYLKKLVWPFHLALDYGHSPPKVLAAGHCYWEWLIPASIAVALCAWRKQRPLLLLGALIFLFGCLPVLGLTASTFQIISTTADRYLYFSMFGAAIALAWVLTAYTNSLLRGSVLAALLICGGVTFRQAGYWKSDKTLWPHEAEENPDSFSIMVSLGETYVRDHDYQQAVYAFVRASRMHALSPGDQEQIHDELSMALYQEGRLDDAIIEERACLAIAQGVSDLHSHWARHEAVLGDLLCQAGRYAEALPYLRSAHQIAPGDQKVSLLLRRAMTQAAESGPRPPGRGGR